MKGNILCDIRPGITILCFTSLSQKGETLLLFVEEYWRNILPQNQIARTGLTSVLIVVSLRFWLAGIVLSLINGFAKAGRLADRARVLAAPPRTGEKIGGEAERKAALNSVVKESKAVKHQLVIDSLDVWLPATGLGVVNVNDGVAGVLGCVL